MRLIESLWANLNHELRLAKYIESAQLYWAAVEWAYAVTPTRRRRF